MGLRGLLRAATAASVLVPGVLWTTVFGSVRGVVHDPNHRPVPGAAVTIQSLSSDFVLGLTSDASGAFESATVPVGQYRVTATKTGFAAASADVLVVSGSAPVLHLQLSLEVNRQSVEVSESALAVPPEVVTPTTVVSRSEIASTPGADRTNSFGMITDYVPGAWMTHDQLHVRGGHQVSWAIDGVPIPNTNIASNVGPQVDPKDIDYVEVQRGGYSADYGDRTYGVFNVVPRTGFERDNEAGLVTTFGSFHQTDDQLTLGGHSEKFAYFGSLTGNRSDYGLETPGPEILHDRVWGLGGLATLIYNPDTRNQLRLAASVRRDDYEIPNDPAAQAAGADDVERERDAVLISSWARTLKPGILLTVSPFYHYNRANYDGGPSGVPVSTTQHRASQYAGAQIVLSVARGRHNARVGVYGFGQHDDEIVRLVANGGSGSFVAQEQRSTGHLESAFLEDQYRVWSWFTLNAGVRLTRFSGALSENAASPRLGASIVIPRLRWVLRGFWGEYYQAPPLSTVSGPLLSYAVTEGLGFIPLHGERDQERQFGLTIPLRGWSFDVNNYNQHARDYFDRNAIGNSNVFYPLTIAGAHLYGWEFTVRSPRLFHRGEVHVAYAYAHALGEGATSGGLTDFAPPAGSFLLDHDQRHTLHTGFSFNLPYAITAAGELYYGSGFTDGSSEAPAHLEGHTTFDVSLGRSFGERFQVTATALNLTNRRFLLDYSPTFGGTHYAEPRQFYVQVRYRFHY
jgi:outer membrane receptor for ferrienterochelin and colicin